MKRNLHIVNMQNKIKHLELENANLVRFLQNTACQGMNQQSDNIDANHVEFSTIQDHNYSMASNLDPVEQEKLQRINKMRASRHEPVEEKSDQNCLIQDLSKVSYKIDESVLKRLS